MTISAYEVAFYIKLYLHLFMLKDTPSSLNVCMWLTLSCVVVFERVVVVSFDDVLWYIYFQYIYLWYIYFWYVLWYIYFYDIFVLCFIAQVTTKSKNKIKI